MAASLIPRATYFIRTRPDNHIMSCNHNNKTYVVGFMFPEEAKYILPKVSVSSQLTLKDTENTYACLTISKRININKLPCYVQEKQFVEVLSMPWTDNLGIAFAYDLFEETKDAYHFEAQLIDPADDPAFFLQRCVLEDEI
jgi:hypothetical protein